MSSRQWIYGCVLVLSAVTAAQATTFFVDAGQGNDANTGLSAADPFVTIQRAIDAAAALPGPDLIQIAAGQYLENLTISNADGLTLSGSSGAELIASPLTDAIQIAAGDITISALAVQAGNKGISAAGTATSPVASLTLRDLVVTNNVKDGLNAANVAEVTVSGCTFRDNGGAAVKVQFAEDLTVSHCTLASNTGRGIRVDDVARVVVSHCQILDNDDDGFKMVAKVLKPADTSLSISDTTVSGSGDDGIDLELLGDIRLTNVTVAGTRVDDGVSIDDSLSVSVIGGTYADNKAEGLDIDDVLSIRLVSVVSTGNKGGLQVTAEGGCDVELSIVGSEFTNSTADGVSIRENGSIVQWASLTSVTATGNGARGLNIVMSGTAKLNAITSENNGAPDILP